MGVGTGIAIVMVMVIGIATNENGANYVCPDTLGPTLLT